MDILFPRQVQQEQFDEAKLRLLCEQLYTIWHQDYEARHPWKVENIRFTHDPNWNTHFLSIQSARDGGHAIWKATKIVCTFAFGVI